MTFRCLETLLLNKNETHSKQKIEWIRFDEGANENASDINLYLHRDH